MNIFFLPKMDQSTTQPNFLQVGSGWLIFQEFKKTFTRACFYFSGSNELIGLGPIVSSL